MTFLEHLDELRKRMIHTRRRASRGRGRAFAFIDRI